jgi:hypothetical protein
MDELVVALTQTGVSYNPILSLEECYASFRDAVGNHLLPKHSTQMIQLAGSVFYYNDKPVLILHVVDLSEVLEEEEASYFSECAMLCRVAEMYFASQDIYPVLLAIQGGSAAFWKHMEILQFGQTTHRNIFKVYGHSIPIVISYTYIEEILTVGQRLLEEAKQSLIIPVAER